MQLSLNFKTFIKQKTTFSIKDYSTCLKHELENIDSKLLPLHQLTTQGGIGMISEDKITATILNTQVNGNNIDSTVGIFFNEVIAGCSCGDEPYKENVYGELNIQVNKNTAEVSIVIV